jgi:hypothetical protein
VSRFVVITEGAFDVPGAVGYIVYTDEYDPTNTRDPQAQAIINEYFAQKMLEQGKPVSFILRRYIGQGRSRLYFKYVS